MMSRGAFEANLITFFLPIGIYFFLKGLENTKFLAWSAFFLGLNLFTYHSSKLITPIIIAGLVLIYRQEIRKLKIKKLLPAIIIFSVFFLGLINTFRLGGGSRISERSITAGALEAGAEKKIKLIQDGANPIVARIFHNKYQVVAQRFISNYTQYFSSKFLLTNGVSESTYGMLPGIGVLYVFEGLLLLGLIPIVLKKEYRNVTLAIVAWLLISPLPAALATGVGYSGNRGEGMLPVLQILSAFGLIGWILVLSKINKRVVSTFLVISLIILTFETYTFVKKYFQYPSNRVASGMLYQNLEAGEWLSENGNGKDVIVSRSLSEPQIFIAFGSLWDPNSHQEETKNWKLETWVDQIPEYHLGKYTIKSLDWKNDRTRINTLIVGRPEEFPVDVTPLKVFYFPDDAPNIFIIDPSQKLYAKVN